MIIFGQWSGSMADAFVNVLQFCRIFCWILWVSLQFFHFKHKESCLILPQKGLEKILNEKLNPLSEQLKKALAMVKMLNTKIELMEDTFRTLQEENKALKQEQVSLKAQVLRSANDLKLVQKSLNDLEQYTRRDCLEIRGIPLPLRQSPVVCPKGQCLDHFCS